MGKIQELPALDRPREKALRYGINTLTDAELLAIAISSGYQGVNAREIANSLLEKCGGLQGLKDYPFNELTKFKGVKDKKALIVSVIYEIHRRLLIKDVEEVEADNSQIYQKYLSIFSKENQEHLALVITNRRNKITFEKTLYVGTENNLVFSYKEIWKQLILHDAKGFILVHNHPTNKAEPSDRDIVITAEIKLEANRIGIPLKDHLIIGDDGYYSIIKKQKTYISY